MGSLINPALLIDVILRVFAAVSPIFRWITSRPQTREERLNSVFEAATFGWPI
jgi:hypothetical protein